MIASLICSSFTSTSSSSVSVEDAHGELARHLDGDAVGDRVAVAARPPRRRRGSSAAARAARARSPAARPPPPTGMSTVSTSGSCSASSSPSVPCPAITCSSSKACTKVAPVCARRARARRRARRRSPRRRARSRRRSSSVGSTFAIGASSGMKIVAGMPSSRAAQATAWPWLPAQAATTPAARSAAVSVASRFMAPRILNEPVRCRFSAFSIVERPVSCEERVGAVDGRHAHVAGEPLARRPRCQRVSGSSSWPIGKHRARGSARPR